MTLIKSISGIRGTIGGFEGESLTPLDIVKYTAAYAHLIKENNNSMSRLVVIGRDARISGFMLSRIVSGTLISCGLDVLDIGLSTTPTVEYTVANTDSIGGIILTASHNPKQWNALKLLNSQGEFISQKNAEKIIDLVQKNLFEFSLIEKIGCYSYDDSYNEKHIDQILDLKLVDIDLIKKSNFKVVVDAVNSSGGIFVPNLLKKLNVECVKLHCEPNGKFPHNPEPLECNLQDLSNKVVAEGADFGIAVDPDVDRLAFVCEDGSFFGEEYTLVAIADFVLSKCKGGNTVSNLSSTRALSDITKKNSGLYFPSAVGEVNVVAKMKEVEAIIGGEGNGGVIFPDIHYGRDALTGIALFLTHIAERKINCSELRKTYPDYYISKQKIKLRDSYNSDVIMNKLKEHWKTHNINTVDGLKIDFENEWIHIRKSNTEPIIRIYAESSSQEKADNLALNFIEEIKNKFL